jgi:hypothetical protein
MCRARILTIAVIFSKRLQIHDYDFFGATTIGVVCAAVWYPPPPPPQGAVRAVILSGTWMLLLQHTVCEKCGSRHRVPSASGVQRRDFCRHLASVPEMMGNHVPGAEI